MYDSTNTLALYMMAAPDTARLVNEFQNVLGKANSSTAHHEESPELQKRFIKDVKNFLIVLRERGSPFLDKGVELKSIDTRDVMEPEVMLSLKQLKELGEILHEAYTETRLRHRNLSLTDTITRNGFEQPSG